MHQRQPSEEATQTKPGSFLDSAVVTLVFCAATFGAVGYRGLEFPDKNRSEVFAVFLVLSTAFFLIGSACVWFKFNERAILDISEYQIRTMTVSRRVIYMACLAAPLGIGSAVYFIGGFKGSFLIGATATCVAFCCSMVGKAMKSRYNQI